MMKYCLVNKINFIVYRLSICMRSRILAQRARLPANCVIDFVITITIIIISEADGPEHGFLGLSRLSHRNLDLDWRA